MQNGCTKHGRLPAAGGLPASLLEQPCWRTKPPLLLNARRPPNRARSGITFHSGSSLSGRASLTCVGGYLCLLGVIKTLRRVRKWGFDGDGQGSPTACGAPRLWRTFSLTSNITLQPTRYGVPPLTAGNGLRPFSAGRSCRHASARG